MLAIIAVRRRGRRRADRQQHRYGLAGGVWSGDQERALAASPGGCAPARSTSTAGAFNPLAPFGGYKQSGIGREAGALGLEEFLETKAIQR